MSQLQLQSKHGPVQAAFSSTVRSRVRAEEQRNAKHQRRMQQYIFSHTNRLDNDELNTQQNYHNNKSDECNGYSDHYIKCSCNGDDVYRKSVNDVADASERWEMMTTCHEPNGLDVDSTKRPVCSKLGTESPFWGSHILADTPQEVLDTPRGWQPRLGDGQHGLTTDVKTALVGLAAWGQPRYCGTPRHSTVGCHLRVVEDPSIRSGPLGQSCGRVC